MKRNWNIIRSLLLTIEADRLSDINDPNQSREVMYHTALLLDAELASGTKVNTQGGVWGRITGLTWKGHEFLALARDDDRWTAAMQKTGGEATIDILSDLLKNDATCS